MRRTIDVAVVAALAIAMVGLVSGVEGTSHDDVVPRVDAPPTGSGVARSYVDMRARDYGVNRDLPAAWFAGIAPPPVAQTAESPAMTDEAIAAVLERRAQRRAYDGAPPAIPHAVDQHGAPACLACHERGARIGSQLVAPVMSHERRDSCLQCHVAARPTALPPPDNTFAGERPVRGGRAWAGAPPAVPHATFMRERCDSCHGSLGALRVSHPWRKSCRQCHAPPAGAP